MRRGRALFITLGLTAALTAGCGGGGQNSAYLQSPEYFTMPRGPKQIVDGYALSGEYHWELAIAASVLAVIPLIIVFAIAQRSFLDGLATQARQG